MPVLTAAITKAWRHANEPDRIHYTIVRPNGEVRHLYAERGTGLYGVLNEHLLVKGYTGPRSAEVVT